MLSLNCVFSENKVKMRTKRAALSSFSDFAADAEQKGADPARVDPHIPEKTPAQGVFVQELFAPAQTGHDGADIPGAHPLGVNLGIPQQLLTAVGEHAYHPVEHIFLPKPGNEDHVAPPDGARRQIQEDRIPGGEVGRHAGARNGHRDMGVPLPQKGADGIEIALSVEDLRHNAAPFLFSV